MRRVDRRHRAIVVTVALAATAAGARASAAEPPLIDVGIGVGVNTSVEVDPGIRGFGPPQTSAYLRVDRFGVGVERIGPPRAYVLRNVYLEYYQPLGLDGPRRRGLEDPAQVGVRLHVGLASTDPPRDERNGVGPLVGVALSMRRPGKRGGGPLATPIDVEWELRIARPSYDGPLDGSLPALDEGGATHRETTTIVSVLVTVNVGLAWDLGPPSPPPKPRRPRRPRLDSLPAASPGS